MINENKKLKNKDLEKLFSDDDKCYAFLSEIKWADKYICRKCGNTNYCLGKTPHSKRCTRCKYDESASAFTIFHNIKFPISKAFYIAFQICYEKKNISSYEFARKLSLMQMTCWKFRDKILKALENSKALTKKTKIDLKKIFIP